MSENSSLKDDFTYIRKRVDSIYDKLDGKADASDVKTLDDRLRSTEKTVSNHKTIGYMLWTIFSVVTGWINIK